MPKPVSYSIEGQGKTILFIHGFCETKEIWHYFKNYFTNSYQVLCIDLPGFGGSIGLEKNTSIEAMSGALHDTLQHLNIEKPVLVGHSLGGYVALAYAEQYPNDLAGICLFHSTAFEDASEKKENRNKTIEYVKNHGVDAFCNPFVPGLFFHKRRAELKSQIDFVLQMARKTSLSSILETTAAMRDRKERIGVLKNIKIPVSFIIGKEDTAVTFDKSIAQCHLAKNSQALFLAETGHMGMLEREQECADFLSGFLKDIFKS